MNSKVKKRPTIKDIAALVGVHHSTVSRALNPKNSSQISTDVVEKIRKAVKELGYYPNLVASSLKQNRSYTFGVLIPDLQNALFPRIIRGIQDAAEKFNYTIVIVNTDDDEEKEHEALQMMRARSIEGVIVATARRKDSLVEECLANNMPCVLINRTVDEGAVDAVILDEEFAIRSTLDHLIGLQHSKIVHIAGPQYTSTGFERAQAFTRYMESKGLDGSVIEYADKFTIEDGYSAFRRMLTKSQGFTAVVACSDLIALGCMDAIKEMGLRIPEDISLVGHNNIPITSRISPALTSVSFPQYEMGEMAANILLEYTFGTRKKPVITRLQPRLVTRESTAKAPSS